jgi:hypothetical protein
MPVNSSGPCRFEILEHLAQDEEDVEALSARGCFDCQCAASAARAAWSGGTKLAFRPKTRTCRRVDVKRGRAAALLEQ